MCIICISVTELHLHIVFVLLYSMCRSVSVFECVNVIRSFTYVKDLSLSHKYNNRPDSPSVTLTWHACKCKIHKLHQRYSLMYIR